MKINARNKEKINAAIKKSEGSRVTSRTLDADMIESTIERIEKRLSSLLSKKDWVKLRFDVDYHAQSFPGSYNGSPQSTQFIVERFSSGWFVVEIGRNVTRPPSREVIPINLGAKQQEIADFVRQPSNF